MCTGICSKGTCGRTSKTVLRVHSQKQLNASFVMDSAVKRLGAPLLCILSDSESRVQNVTKGVIKEVAVCPLPIKKIFLLPAQYRQIF
jgi:hypothetical protein